MLLPAIVVWAVDRITGQTVWCLIAGLITVPLAIDVALYAVANPRVLKIDLFRHRRRKRRRRMPNSRSLFRGRSNERPETASEL